MDIDNDLKRNKDNTEDPNHETEGEDINIGSMEPGSAGTDNLDSGKMITSIENENIRYGFGDVDTKNGPGKNSSKSTGGRKKVNQKVRGRPYLLRSSNNGVRVLRSMSKEKSTSPTGSASTSVNPVTEKKRKWRRIKKPSIDEFSRTRKRVRYLLTRMNYEQNLLDAYSGEGWKGQSLEKIRPEKELERAKSEIIRCKLRIRELFRHLDSLLSEGRLEESLFDAEGEISSEDISCAKCCSRDLSADNDIILCDGTCNRGFHQKCLNPPLLSEDIPPGDIGWLCPACDCKVDCIDLLNELQGINLSLEDMWEKIFPEAAAIANGDRQFDDLGLPSDDSEDDDYNPNALDINVETREEGSSSEDSSSAESGSGESGSGESYFTASSGHSDSRASNCDRHYDTLGLPSDDSEDDDYDPDGPNPNEKVQKDGSSLDESDFTSDSDEFMEELNKSSDPNEASASSLCNLKPLEFSGQGRHSKDVKASSLHSELLSVLEPGMNENNDLLVSGKRQRERLDYKKLYDETYGEASSGTSDDDDWSGMTTTKNGKKDGTTEGSVALPKANTRTIYNHRSSKRSKGDLTELNTKAHSDQLQVSPDQLQVSPDQLQVSPVISTPEKTYQKWDSAESHPAGEQPNESPDSDSRPDSSANKGTPTQRNLGRKAAQRLCESFKENQFLTPEKKRSLAEELGISLKQTGRWFEKARRRARAVAEKSSQAGFSTPSKVTQTTKTHAKHSDSENTVRSSACNKSTEKRLDQTVNSNSGGKVVISNGGNIQTADEQKRKAIARELRKMKKNR